MGKNTQNKKTNCTNLTLSDKKRKFLEILEKKEFNISEACKSRKISRQTYYDWLNTDDEFSQSCKDLEEADMDNTESALRVLIKEKNPAAIIFKLKTKGRKRGYSESMELEISKPISEVRFDDGKL